MEHQDDMVHRLKNELEVEFCPPLDTSLFAAVFGDFEYSPENLIVLKETLSELAAGAVVDDSLPSNSGIDTNSDSILISANTSTSEVIGSPLAFLRAAFPDLPIQLLQDAIDNASNQELPLDMERLVEELLSSELLALLETDGLDTDSRQAGPEPDWTIAGSRIATSKRGKSNNKPQRLILGDVRQRQLMTAKPDRDRLERVDPWTQLSSIAEYVSPLLGCPASTLLSAFHSPDHPTLFDALATYINSAGSSNLTEEDVDQHLISMAEMMLTDHEAEEWDAQWARKCIHATNASFPEAIQLYELLMSLENLPTINHLPAPSRTPNTSTPSTSKLLSTPTTPSPRIEIRPRQHKSKYPAPKPENASEWQIVKKRPPKASTLHPHAEFIPAYQNLKAVPAWTVKTTTDDVTRNREIEEGWRNRRIEALRKASQHWQRSQGSYGPQIAGYYAEEANKYLKESKEAAVEAARALVVRNRIQSKGMGFNTHNAVDLHGMRREEALVIVRDALAARAALKDASQREEPLRFISGKGRHSVGGQSILLPALKNMLNSEGWTYREIEAGLVVYGKR